MRTRSIAVAALLLAAAALHSVRALSPDESSPAAIRAEADRLFSQNNFAEAETLYRRLALDENNDGAKLPDDYGRVVECLNRLNRVKEFDAFAESVVATHDDHWQLLARVARTFLHHEVPSSGFLIAGEFERGHHRGGGTQVSSMARDRVRGLQLMQQALPLLKAAPKATAAQRREFYLNLAELVGRDRHAEAWKLQLLTDLSELPDYEEGGGFGGGGRGLFSVPAGNAQFGFPRPFPSNSGAPVDENGKPVFHQLPASWEAATTDGERWRWALEQAASADPDRRSEIDLQWAMFLQAQFGVQTIEFGAAPVIHEDEEAGEPVARKLHELADDETIAKLATGVQKLSLPEEFNHLTVIKRVIERKDDQHRNALENLIGVRMNRHQYPQAVELLKQVLALATDDDDRKSVQQRIDQIVGNWLQFEPTGTQPAGRAPSFEVRYRNGAEVQFEARPVRIDRLLDDLKAYLQSGPERVDYRRVQIEDLGFHLLEGDRERYLGPPAANWSVELDPPKNHFDAVHTIKVPVEKAGAWFVTGRMQDGNEARMVLWVADTALSRKRIEAGTLFFVADAVTGRPVANANLEFFGWRNERIDRTRNYRILTKRAAGLTDKNGMTVRDGQDLDRQYNWMTIARTQDGRLAFDGFQGIWTERQIRPLNYSPRKVYSITDRPVYRPGHSVKYRLWVRQPRFSQDDAAYAGKTFALQIRDPKGELLVDTDVKTDQWAGIDGEWQVADDATLGRYQIIVGERFKVTRSRQRNGRRENFTEERIRQFGSGSFRVEEYRKPEFEVTVDAPEKPIELGEDFNATINARYLFGAPVTKATVHYKVERRSQQNRWFPAGRWDWLYSPGYWWFAPNYEWYPGWNRWGCFGPIPIWRGWHVEPPEIVAEATVPIGEDGTVKVNIDTAAALREHSDTDHSYQITAEVVDQSRRTINGSGNVTVAREPFKVFVWTNRGHYRTGDTATVGIQTRTADGKFVSGEGKVSLRTVTYEDGKPIEREVEHWNVDLDESGRTDVKMELPKSGQYRVSATITDAAGHEQEGGYLFFVQGPDEDGSEYRFNELELITDQREYSPGDVVKLQINTDQADSTVLLFLRPMNGLCPAPQVLQLDGKSTVVNLKIGRDDMPNIFVEAITIADGELHSAVREIIVPPVQKVANVEVISPQQKYRPGTEASVQLKLTDIHGKPFVGNTVVSVYDAGLEYIAASTIPEIRSFFWNVRRRHNPSVVCSLNRMSSPLYKSNETTMQILAGDQAMMFGAMGGMGGGFGGGGFGAVGAFGGTAVRRGGAMPMPMAAADSMETSAAPEALGAALATQAKKAEGGAEPQMAEAAIRSEFADTAFWAANLNSDQDGIIDVRFKVPDNLTTWKVKAWTLGQGTRVGSGSTEIISSKDLIIRPQTPRFFTETDQVTLSAVVHNYLQTAKTVQVVLEQEGGQLQLSGDAVRSVDVPAGGEVRVDWQVDVVASGQAKIRMKALTDEESDAAELTVPCQVHGLLKTESYTGVVRSEQNSSVIEINVPAARIEEQSRLEIRFSPTLAGAMVDALPYLLEYPYGCTEQTLNRFLPAAITQHTLQQMGVRLEDVQKKRTNLNAQELGDPKDRAAQWQRYQRNPVFDTAEMQRIIRTGVTDLTNMQLTDGGWGWFSGFHERSTPHLTSIVVHGLTIAQKNDVAVLPDVIGKGVQWLKNYQAAELEKLREGDWRRAHPDELKNRNRPYRMQADNMDAFVAFVLAEHDANDPAMTDYLYRDRGSLSAYGLSLVGLVLDFQQDVDRRNMVLRNLNQFLVVDDENQTAWLNLGPNGWWYWYGSDNEAMARYLQLLLKVDPNSDTAPRLVKYLLNNRKHGTYWHSTRDTALVVEAFADYLSATGELKPDMTVQILVDGQLQKKARITGDNLFSFDNVVLLEGDGVRTGAHKVEIRRDGSGPVYFNAYLTNFTKEDPITAAGLEVKVARRFYRLERDDRTVNVEGDRGQAVTQQTTNYKRIPLENLASVTSGQLIEVELVVESKNDYEYLLLEDCKPSGFEPDDQRSGYIFEGLRAYRELRDDRVSFFLSDLARGRHSVTYRMRAEMPSRKVSALPAEIEGMYAPELVGNSDEFKLQVNDRE